MLDYYYKKIIKDQWMETSCTLEVDKYFQFPSLDLLKAQDFK